MGVFDGLLDNVKLEHSPPKFSPFQSFLLACVPQPSQSPDTVLDNNSPGSMWLPLFGTRSRIVV